MSDTKHTPEPWEVQGKKIVGADGTTVCYVKGSNMIGLNDQERRECFDSIKHKARRIVACVNACQGIHTATLENVPTFGQIAIETRDEFLAIKAQRDQLIDMLAEVMEIDSDAEFMRLEKEMKVLPYNEETKAAHLMFDAYSGVKAVMK